MDTRWNRQIAQIFFAVIMMAMLLGVAVSADAPTETTFLALLSEGQSLDVTVQSARAAGVQVRHTFPPDAFIGVTTTDALPEIAGAAIFRTPADVPADITPSARLAMQVWQALIAPQTSARTAATLDAHPLHEGDFADAFIAPITPARQLEALAATSPRPGYTESSQFLAGSIAVGIVFPESNGVTDPSTEDWTSAETTQVVSEIVAALDWWAQREPAAQLTMVYDVGSPVPTAVEPISRPYTDQQLWITDAMTAMGFEGYSYFDRVRAYNNYLRQTYGTDWAFTIFVVDSSADADNRFSDGHFAYAYLGGPFMVMTSGNNGYGISNMDAVTAHEIGHVFRALDQYATANVACDAVSGYLQVENQNSQQGCATDVPSIMRGQISPFVNAQIDDFARGQLGWADSNGNGVLDVVDAGLLVSGVTTVTNVSTTVFTITGRVEETPFPSPKYRAVLINSLTAVNFAVDGGAWQAAQPADGAFDDYAEDFMLTTGTLTPGTHTITLQTVDNFGVQHEQVLATVTVPGTEPVETTFASPSPRLLAQPAADAVDGSAVQRVGGIITGVEYRLDGGAWQAAQPADGAFDSASEAFVVALDTTGLSLGTHILEARAIDSLGNVDTTPAVMTVTVQGQFQIFLPLVVR